MSVTLQGIAKAALKQCKFNTCFVDVDAYDVRAFIEIKPVDSPIQMFEELKLWVWRNQMMALDLKLLRNQHNQLLQTDADKLVISLIEEIEYLHEALSRIDKPIWWMQEDQKRMTGSINGVDGANAIALSNDPEYLKFIARRAILNSNCIQATGTELEGIEYVLS